MLSRFSLSRHSATYLYSSRITFTSVITISNRAQPSRTSARMMSNASFRQASMKPNGIRLDDYTVPLPAAPTNWKRLAPFPSDPSAPTYSFQDKLPHLPVPALTDTLSKLKTSLRAMTTSDAEYEATLRKIESFGQKNGVGEALQSRLEQRARDVESEGGRQHWLDEWWDEVAYMGYRDPVLINVSYYYGFDLPPSMTLSNSPDSTVPDEFAIHRAASTIRSALFFRQKLLNGEIPADSTKGGPFCMDTWRWMFDATRIPHRPSDYALSFTPSTRDPNNVGIDGHFITIRNNRFWKVPNSITDSETGKKRLLSTSEIAHQLAYIVNETRETYPAIGNLTSNDRDAWADDFAVLASEEQNKANLHEIHSASFVLCLDLVSPRPSTAPSKGPHGNGTSESTASGSDPVSFSQWLWHGGLAGKDSQLGNRWYDKPVQFILSPNGEMGIVGEHSVMDGTPTTRMCDEVLDAVYSPSFDHGPNKPNPDVITIPLDFACNAEIHTRISKAKDASDALVAAHNLTYHLTDYGKKEIKTFGVGPDGWAQMVIQLAYDRWCQLHGKKQGSRETGGTYEAATTRKFKKGRTETIRTVSNEVRDWLAAMRKESTSPEEKKKLLITAVKKHLNDAKDAGNGAGIDRHLLGLRLLVKPEDGEAALELFNDPLFQRAKKWALSTSAVFSKHFPIYGWGEVVPDGFGVPYMTGYDDRLQFTITSRVEMDNAGFKEEIKKAAEELRDLFRDSSGQPPNSRL